MTNKMTVHSTPRSHIKELTITGLMTAAVCIIAPFSIPIPISPVPISLTNFAIYIIVYAVGLKTGTISYFIYLLLGTAGLPVFSSFSGGLGKLAGPTGGYLLGFLFLAFIQGFFMKMWPGSNVFAIIGMIVGTVICYLFGTAWLAFQADLSFPAALAAGVIPYLPGDTVKILIAAITGPKIHNAVKRI